MKTFYMASSSKHRLEIAKHGEMLSEYGLRWYANWDWTRFEMKDVTDPLQLAGVVAQDITSAMRCDVFILWCAKDDPPTMSWAELGARLAAGGEAHVLLNGAKDNVFYSHPCVTTHASLEDFMQWLIKDYSLSYRSRPSGRLPLQKG